MAGLDFVINSFDEFIRTYNIPTYHTQKKNVNRPVFRLTIGTTRTFDSLLDSIEKSEVDLDSNADLYEPICRYCDEKNISETTLYKKGNFDKSVLTRIRGMRNTNYVPQKNILIRICLVLELDHNQTQELLYMVGYSLANDVKADKIISYAINKKVYDIIEIDDAIYKKTGKYYLSSK